MVCRHAARTVGVSVATSRSFARIDGGFESWTDISDVGERFNGLVPLDVEEEVYLRVEDLFLAARSSFGRRLCPTSSTSRVSATRPTRRDCRQRSDCPLGPRPVVRANLRGALRLRPQVRRQRFPTRLRMRPLHVCRGAGRLRDGRRAHVTQMGLYVETGITPAYWDNDGGEGRGRSLPDERRLGRLAYRSGRDRYQRAQGPPGRVFRGGRGRRWPGVRVALG